MSDLYSEILKSESIPLTESQLVSLKENYTHMIIDGMDMDTLVTFAFDSIMQNIEMWSEEEVKDEILDLYDEETLQSLMPE